MASSGFGKRVYQARLDLQARLGRAVSQKEIADAVGVHQVTVGEWERGKKEPGLDNLAKLAEALGADLTWLVTGMRPIALKEVPEGTPSAVPVYRELPTPSPEPPPQRPFKEVSRHAKAPLHPIKPQDQGKGRKKA